MGIFGFLVVFGILLYEIRNTALYDALWLRASCLEALLGFDSLYDGLHRGGALLSRPSVTLRIGRATLGHSKGLALVYGPAMGAWAWMIATPCFRLAEVDNTTYPSVIAAAIALLVMRLLVVARKKSAVEIDRPGYVEGLPAEIQKMVKGGSERAT